MPISSSIRALIFSDAGLVASVAEGVALVGTDPVFLRVSSDRAANLTSAALLELTYNNIAVVPDYCNISDLTLMLWQKSQLYTVRGILHSTPASIDVVDSRSVHDVLYLVPHLIIYLFAIYCQYKYTQS
jgi:hypothetical protein